MLGREDLKYTPLAAVGIGKGLLEVYALPAIKSVRPSSLAWGAILGSALLYDVYAVTRLNGETLSERCDSAIERHPVMTLGAIAVTAGHLANIIPSSLDPLAAFGRQL